MTQVNHKGHASAKSRASPTLATYISIPVVLFIIDRFWHMGKQGDTRCGLALTFVYNSEFREIPVLTCRRFEFSQALTRLRPNKSAGFLL